MFGNQKSIENKKAADLAAFALPLGLEPRTP